MKTRTKSLICAAAACLVVAAGLQVAHASGPIAVYARVDKVTLTPDSEKAERIRIDGVFSVTTDPSRNAYSAPQAGYLYFALPTVNTTQALKEWADLKNIASRQLLGMGAIWEGPAAVRVRKADEPEASPDAFPMGNGLIRLLETNPRAKALADYK